LIALNEAIVNLGMKIFLSVAEIADVTKKEKTTVLRWIKAGRFGNIRKVRISYSGLRNGRYARRSHE